MCVERKASVQDDTEKTRIGVDPNFLSTNEESRLSSTAIAPSGKGTYLTVVSIQIQFPFLAPGQYRVNC